MGLIIFGIMVLLLFWLTILNKAQAVTAFICMFVVEQWGTIYVPFIAQNGTLFNILILSLLIISWFRLPPGSTFEFMLYPIRMVLIGLLFYALVSSAWAPVDALPIERFLVSGYYLVAVMFIAPVLLRSPADFTRVLDALNWLGGAIVIAFAYIPTFTNRAVSASEVDLANLADEAVALPLALASFAGTVAIVTVIRVKITPVQILWTTFVFVSAMLLMAKTGSRGQFAFTLGAIMLSLPTLWRGFSINKVFLYFTAALLMGVTLFLVINTENALSARLTEQAVDGAFGQRFELTAALLEHWSTNLTAIVFGLGSSASWAVVGVYIHNLTFEVLAELGLIGFCILNLAVVWIIRLAYSSKIRQQLTTESARDFAALYGCWLLAYFTSFKQYPLIDSFEFLLFAVLLEKCVSAGRLLGAKKRRRRRRRAEAA